MNEGEKWKGFKTQLINLESASRLYIQRNII